MASWSGFIGAMRATLGRPRNIIYASSRPPLSGFEGQAPESLPSVYGCAALLSDALVSLDWLITKPAANGGRDRVTEGAAEQCLESWSLDQRWAWIWNGLISGNGIAHVRRNGSGEPEELETYPSGRAFLNLYDDNSIRYSLAPMAGESFEAAEADVCCLRYRPSGLDPRIGVTPLMTVSPTIAMLLASRAGTTATQLQAAQPSGYLSTAGRLDRERAAEIKERWDTVYSGPAGRGKTAVLEQGLTYTQINPADLTKLVAVETQNLGTAEICRVFAVPQSVLQADASGSRSSAVEDRRRLGAFAVSPLARLIENAIGSKLLTRRQLDLGTRMTVDTSVSLLGEGSEMADVLSKLLNAGVITPNEGRAWLQYGSSGASADILRSPTNTWPIESWATAQPKSADTAAPDQFSAGRALQLIHGGKDAAERRYHLKSAKQHLLERVAREDAERTEERE